jgi:hypothetical protein
MSTSAKSAVAPSFAAKMLHRHETREKIAFTPITFFHFPAFARNMTGPWDQGAAMNRPGFRFAAAALVCPCCHGHVVVRGASGGDLSADQATMRQECEDERQKRF